MSARVLPFPPRAAVNSEASAPRRERRPFDVELYSLGGGQAMLAARGAGAEILLELRVSERVLQTGTPPLGARLVTQLRAWARELAVPALVP